MWDVLSPFKISDLPLEINLTAIWLRPLRTIAAFADACVLVLFIYPEVSAGWFILVIQTEPSPLWLWRYHGNNIGHRFTRKHFFSWLQTTDKHTHSQSELRNPGHAFTGAISLKWTCLLSSSSSQQCIVSPRLKCAQLHCKRDCCTLCNKTQSEFFEKKGYKLHVVVLLYAGLFLGRLAAVAPGSHCSPPRNCYAHNPPSPWHNSKLLRFHFCLCPD